MLFSGPKEHLLLDVPNLPVPRIPLPHPHSLPTHEIAPSPPALLLQAAVSEGKQS